MKNIFCIIGFHKWVMGILVDRKGNHQTLYRECIRCNKYQTIEKPKEYHPVKYQWVDGNILD